MRELCREVEKKIDIDVPGGFAEIELWLGFFDDGSIDDELIVLDMDGTLRPRREPDSNTPAWRAIDALVTSIFRESDEFDDVIKGIVEDTFDSPHYDEITISSLG